MGCKCCTRKKWCDIHDKEKVVYIELTRGYYDGIEHGNDKFRCFDTSGDGDNIDKRHDFHDGVDADWLFNYILDTNKDNINTFHNVRYVSGKLSMRGTDVNYNGVLEQEDFDVFLTTSRDPEMQNNDREDESELNFDPIPTTNIGDFALYIAKETSYFGMNLSGNLILNQCGTFYR